MAVQMKYVKASEAPAEVDAASFVELDPNMWIAYDVDDNNVMAWGPTEDECRQAARIFV